jgi:hypothetical protein
MDPTTQSNPRFRVPAADTRSGSGTGLVLPYYSQRESPAVQDSSNHRHSGHPVATVPSTALETSSITRRRPYERVLRTLAVNRRGELPEKELLSAYCVPHAAEPVIVRRFSRLVG